MDQSQKKPDTIEDILRVSVTGTDRKMLCDKVIFTAFCIEKNFPAFTVSGYGYIQYHFSNKTFYYHRYPFNSLEEGYEIDHINGDRFDCRLSNLRVATKSQQRRNMNNRLSTQNSSGVRGVNFDKERQIWLAQIKINGKHIYLGRFASKECAIAARRLAEEKFGFTKIV